MVRFEGFAKHRKTCLTINSELQCLKSLTHPNIVRLHSVFTSDEMGSLPGASILTLTLPLTLP